MFCNVMSGVGHSLNLSHKRNNVDRLRNCAINKQTGKIINFQYNRPNTDDDETYSF